jgi:hypothetical protein
MTTLPRTANSEENTAMELGKIIFAPTQPLTLAKVSKINEL